MGAYPTATVQVDRSLYDALVLLGYSFDITNVHDESITGDSLTERLSQTEQGVRAAAGSTWEHSYVLMPRELLHDLFPHLVLQR